MGRSRWIDDDQVQRVHTEFSEPRVHCPEKSSEAKEVKNYQYTSVPMGIRLKLFFAQLFLLISSVSTEQSQICVMNTVPVKQERWDPCWQDNVTHCSSQQDCCYQHLHFQLKFLHKKVYCKSTMNEWKAKPCDQKLYWCRIFWQQLRSDSTSWQRTLKSSHNFAESVACREYTLPRDEKSSDPNGCIRGNTKIGPVLEVTTSYLQGNCGVEFRIEFVNKDNSHSWLRISHGLNKLVTDLIDKEYDDDEQETSEMKSEEFALKTNVLAFASRSKAKAKPRRLTSAYSSTRTVPILERSWTDIEPGTQSSLAYPVAKRLNTLLRHCQVLREEDGAIEFRRLKDDLQNKFEYSQSQYWSDDVWKSKMQGGGGNKKRFQYCTDSSGQEIL